MKRVLALGGSLAAYVLVLGASDSRLLITIASVVFFGTWGSVLARALTSGGDTK